MAWINEVKNNNKKKTPTNFEEYKNERNSKHEHQLVLSRAYEEKKKKWPHVRTGLSNGHAHRSLKRIDKQMLQFGQEQPNTTVGYGDVLFD